MKLVNLKKLDIIPAELHYHFHTFLSLDDLSSLAEVSKTNISLLAKKLERHCIQFYKNKELHFEINEPGKLSDDGKSYLNHLLQAARRLAPYSLRILLDFQCTDSKDQGKKISATNFALLVAASAGLHKHVAKLLSQPGVNVNFRRETNALRKTYEEYKDRQRSNFTDGCTALALAAFYGHYETVKLLLNHKGIDANPLDWEHLSPFALAAWGNTKKHFNVLQLLLAHPATNVNLAMNGISQAMRLVDSHYASLEALRAIFSHPKFKVTYRNNNSKKTVLDIIKYYYRQNERIMGFFHEFSPAAIDSNKEWKGNSFLHSAQWGFLDNIREWLTLGAPLNYTNQDGVTALMLSVHHGAEAVVEFLLSTAGIDVNITDKNSRSALFHAAVAGHSHFVTALLERKADPNEADFTGATPLICAAIHGREGVVDILLKQPNIEVNYYDAYGNHALIAAICFGRKSIITKLLAHDAQVDHVNISGDTPLIIAVRYNDLETVKALLAKVGHNITHVNKEGETARSLSINKPEIYRLLEKHLLKTLQPSASTLPNLLKETQSSKKRKSLKRESFMSEVATICSFQL